MTENGLIEPHTRIAGDLVHCVTHRWRSNLLGFPHLCVKTACRRTRRCSRDPNICMSRLAPLVSPGVRSGVDTLVRGHIHGLSYEQMRAQAPWAIEVWEEWRAKIRESIRETAAIARPRVKKVRPRACPREAVR